ncbi:MAG: hypothetical protein WC711_01155 [Candidatus Staskawiczbacteria bacterium]|jgi:hypothetical protein
MSQPWKTIFNDTFNTQGLINAIQLAGMRVQPAGLKAVEKFFVPSGVVHDELVRNNLGRWGCSKISGDKVCEVAANFGLRCCSIECILKLRLEYNDQPTGGYIRVPTIDSEGNLWMFVLYNHEREGMCLSAYDVRPRDREQPYYEFVFAKVE